MSSARIQRVVVGELESNCWLVGDGADGPLLVIDPGSEPERVLDAIGGRPVAAVVLTHGHFDHIGGASDVVAETGAPLFVHEADAERLEDPDLNGGAAFGYFVTAPGPARLLADGDVVEAGALSLDVIETPGHTPGSICLFARDVGDLFCGDTLFRGSVGRTDFPGGDPRALRESIARLASLPASTVAHPGHGPDTTLEFEARANPFWPRSRD